MTLLNFMFFLYLYLDFFNSKRSKNKSITKKPKITRNKKIVKKFQKKVQKKY